MKKILFPFLFFMALIICHPSEAQTYCDTACTFPYGNNVEDGNMFEVEAQQEISINTLWIVTTGTPGYIKIYYKYGPYAGFESTPSAWTLIDTMLLNYTCANTVTLMFPFNIYMTQGSTVSFYVTGNGSGMQLAYNSGTAEGNYVMSDGYVLIREGKGLTYPFTPIAGARIWSGMVDYCLGPTAIASHDNASAYSVMPNPFTTSTTFTIENLQQFENLQLSVYDETGKLVRQENNISTPTVTIDREGLSAGIYFYRLTGDSEQLKSGKLVIED